MQLLYRGTERSSISLLYHDSRCADGYLSSDYANLYCLCEFVP